MSKSSSSGGIGIGTIVVCAFIFNLMFCDDDKKVADVNEVDVKVQDQYVSDETKKEIKENVQKAVTSAKKAMEEMKDKVKKELDKKKEGEKIDEAQNQQPAEKEVVTKREEKVDTLRSMEKDKPKEKEFEKL